MDAKRNSMAILEQKIIELLNKMKSQHLTISQLTAQNAQLKKEHENLYATILEIKEQNKSLTIANNLLGSNEGKSITKNKLNRLIKEVDACIDQLSEVE